MSKLSDKGVFLEATKIFYYMETGPIKISNPVDRILGVLLSRSLLSYNGTKEDITTEKYKILTLKDAREKGYKEEILFLNNHIKENAIKNTTNTTPTISWGKK